MRIRVLLNDGHDAFKPYVPATAHLTEATVLGWTAPDDCTPWEALERVFAFCNGEDPMSGLWYGEGNRSLSVGDVVCLATDGGWEAYACDPSGWSRLDEVPKVVYTPSHM